jgi:hypothetical protein
MRPIVGRTKAKTSAPSRDPCVSWLNGYRKIAVTFSQLFTTPLGRFFVFLCPKSQVNTRLTTVRSRTISMIGLLKIAAFALRAGVWLIEI